MQPMGIDKCPSPLRQQFYRKLEHRIGQAVEDFQLGNDFVAVAMLQSDDYRPDNKPKPKINNHFICCIDKDNNVKIINHIRMANCFYNHIDSVPNIDDSRLKVVFAATNQITMRNYEAANRIQAHLLVCYIETL